MSGWGPVALRNGADVDDPLTMVLGFLEAYWHLEASAQLPPSSFVEADVRLANRGGARISAAQIAEILERRRAIERALRRIPADASLAGKAVPWVPLRELFDAFAGIRGVGFSKTTKALYRKRPALIPILDSVVQTYLEEDDPGAAAPFGERALGFVRGYKRDLDRNRVPLRALRRELARRNYPLTEARILDLIIWSVATGA